jgi:hypothetical protein
MILPGPAVVVVASDITVLVDSVAGVPPLLLSFFVWHRLYCSHVVWLSMQSAGSFASQSTLLSIMFT